MDALSTTEKSCPNLSQPSTARTTFHQERELDGGDEPGPGQRRRRATDRAAVVVGLPPLLSSLGGDSDRLTRDLGGHPASTASSAHEATRLITKKGPLTCRENQPKRGTRKRGTTTSPHATVRTGKTQPPRKGIPDQHTPPVTLPLDPTPAVISSL